MLGCCRDAARIRPEWIRRHRPDARVRQGKFAGENAEPVVVFLVGVRINTWWKVRYWLLLLAVPTTLRELVTAPGTGGRATWRS
jgi:hypothetical protein